MESTTPSPIASRLSSTRDIRRSEPLRWIERRPDIIATADSPPCFARAKTWLDNCRNNHPLCQARHTHHSMLPKRLIDVRDYGRIRLYETSNCSTIDTSYATLSHCWGNLDAQQVCMTRARTLHQRLESIPWEEIPKTFRHAIKVTRALGLGFVWIDSLCIVQDNMQGWRKNPQRCHASTLTLS
jgi:hypothetical protein